MKIRFKVHADGISSVDLKSISSKAERAVAVQVLKDTRPYVPALTESLSNRARVDGKYIIYPGPYARYLYYGKVMVGPPPKVVTDKDLVFNKTVHSKAQSHWFEASKAQNLSKWKRVARKAMEDERK